MINESRLQLKIGIFVILAFFIFIGSLIFFGNKKIWKETYEVTVYFRFTNGVKVGAPVRYSGVNIGKVKQINILDNRNVSLILMINDSVKLHQDVDIYIKSLGVIGETYVDIVGGTVNSELISRKSNIPLQGKDPMNINDFVLRFQSMASEITLFFQNVNSIVQKTVFKKNLLDIMISLIVTTKDLDKLIRVVDRILEKNEENIEDIIAETFQLLSSLNRSSLTVSNLLNGVDEGKGLLGKLFQDEQVYEEVQYFVSDIRRNPWKILYKGRSKRRPRKLQTPSQKKRNLIQSEVLYGFGKNSKKKSTHHLKKRISVFPSKDFFVKHREAS